VQTQLTRRPRDSAWGVVLRNLWPLCGSWPGAMRLSAGKHPHPPCGLTKSVAWQPRCTRSYKATTAQNSGWVLPIKSTHSDHDMVVSKRVVRTSSNPFKARQALECVQAKQSRSHERRHRRTRNATPSTLPDVLKDRVEGVRCRENFAISSGQKVCGSNA
jgi:hypothetical protein